MRNGWRVGLAGAACVALSLGSTASSDEAGLSFVDDRPLTVTWEALQGSGVAVDICNTSTVNQPSVRTSVSGFRFKTATGIVGDLGVVKVEPVTLSLAAGECRALAVRSAVAGENPLASGTYTGVLTASGAGIGLARRQVVIEGPKAAGGVSGTLRTAELRGSRSWNPSAGGVRLVDDELVFTYAGSTAPAFDQGKRVGVLSRGNDIASLSSNGVADSSAPGVVQLPVRAEGVDGHGVFNGLLDITGADGKPIAVVLTVADHLSWAIAAAVLGAALAIALKLLSGRWLPGRRLKWHWSRLFSRYQKERSQLASHAAWAAQRYQGPEEADVNAFVAINRKAIETYKRSTTLFDATAPAYKKATAALGGAFEDASFLGAEDGLAAALKRLQDQIAKLDRFLDDYFPGTPTPFVSRKAKAFIEPPPPGHVHLEVGHAVKVGDKADAMTKLLADWQRWANDVCRHALWMTRLHEVVADDDRDALRRAAWLTIEGFTELLHAADREGIEAVGAVTDLKKAYSILARLAAKYDTAAPAECQRADMEGLREVSGRSGEEDQRPDQPAALEALETTVMQLPAGAAIGIGFAAEALVLVLSVLVAGFAGFRALYEGKAFGSRWDYLAMIALGATTQLVVTGVVSAVDAWRTPKSEKAEKTATASAAA